jgi:hypothetical protein
MERGESNVPWASKWEKALRSSRGLPGIYMEHGGESQQVDGSDEIRIKPSGLKSSEVVIWGDNLRNQGHPHVVGCAKHHGPRNFSFIIVGRRIVVWSLVMKAAYRSK